MKKNKNKLSIIVAIVAFFTFTLTGCQNNQSKNAKKDNQIAVTYTLKDNKKDTEKKTVDVPKKKATVMTGLKKAWKVQSSKGFITSIEGKKQNPKKKVYWTYTLNGKYAKKGADQQKVNNKDKVKFTLAKMK